MTDLVKQLQYQAGCKDPDLHKADVDLLWEAADRIEELEAELSDHNLIKLMRDYGHLRIKYEALVDGCRQLEIEWKNSIIENPSLIAENRNHVLYSCAEKLRALLENDDE